MGVRRLAQKTGPKESPDRLAKAGVCDCRYEDAGWRVSWQLNRLAGELAGGMAGGSRVRLGLARLDLWSARLATLSGWRDGPSGWRCKKGAGSFGWQGHGLKRGNSDLRWVACGLASLAGAGGLAAFCRSRGLAGANVLAPRSGFCGHVPKRCSPWLDRSRVERTRSSG